ncbi:heme-binding protein 2-like [Lineus longissimus]|uniref:heme-binding protein 2-like n=1 Tax=Lineus longissimus TaxID=88925 RepID=UPI002B4DF44D
MLIMRIGGFTILVVVAMAGAEEGTTDSSGYQPPAFCRGVDCPRFTIIKTEKEFEIRKYEVSYWTSTDMYEMDLQDAFRTGFRRLFKYITGENENKEKLAMTCPVLTKIKPGPGPTCESNFTRSFMVPFSHQPSAPAPTDKDVYLNSMPEMTVYVRSFGGFASETDWIQNAADLAQAIGNASLFDDSHFYTAGYDSPYRPTNRHNEVWFLAK